MNLRMDNSCPQINSCTGKHQTSHSVLQFVSLLPTKLYRWWAITPLITSSKWEHSWLLSCFPTLFNNFSQHHAHISDAAVKACPAGIAARAGSWLADWQGNAGSSTDRPTSLPIRQPCPSSDSAARSFLSLPHTGFAWFLPLLPLSRLVTSYALPNQGMFPLQHYLDPPQSGPWRFYAAIELQ